MEGPTLEEKVEELCKKVEKLAKIDVLFSGDGTMGASANQLEEVRSKKDELLKMRAQFHNSLNELEDLYRLFPSAAVETEKKAKRATTMGRLKAFLKPRDTRIEPDDAASVLSRDPDEMAERVPDPTEATHASRRELTEALRSVRAAVELGKDPSIIQEAVEKRTRARRHHIVSLEQSMETLLRLAGVQRPSELDAQLSRKRKEKGEMAQAIQNASKAICLLKEAFGDRLGRAMDPEKSGIDFVTQAWTEFKDHARSRQNFEQATDNSIRELEKLPPQVCYMKCELKPSNYSAVYQWVPVNENKGEHEKAKKELEKRRQEAHNCFEKERDFWLRGLSVEQMPAAQLLREGMQADCQLEGDILVFQQARDSYMALDQERTQQQKLEDRYTSQRESAFKEMGKKAAVRSDMHHNIKQFVLNCEKAETAVKRASGKEQEKAKKDLEKNKNDLAKARNDLRAADVELQNAMIPVSSLVRDFPELSKGLDGFAASLPYELMDHWGGCRTLDEFNDCKLIPGDHRNKTYKATAYDGQVFAVKEYTMKGPMDACAREAALLVRLRHQHVVAVVSIFIDAKCENLYMQMPFYKEGSMDIWISERGPHEMYIRRACYQALLALQHLHALHVVHSDVKPQNILIDSSYKAYLGDMDISVDMAGRRCSTQRMKATRAAVGFTRGFDAPEIEKGATKKTDLFAFSMTLNALDEYSPNVKQAKGALRDSLASKLTAKESTQRPSASDTLGDPFFEGCSDEVPPESAAVCIVCYEQKKLSKGVVCGRSHFVCNEDLHSFVDAELSWLETSTEALERHRANNGLLYCPQCKIEEALGDEGQYDQQTLASHLDKETYQRFEAARDSAKELELWKQHQAEFSKRLEELAAEYEKQERFQQARLNEEATKDFLRRSAPNALQCPKCGVGPVLPEGCADLQAHNGERRAQGTRVAFISNACRKCNFFSRQRSDWHPWNGQIRSD